MKNILKVGLVAAAIALPVAVAFYATAPDPGMGHLPIPNMHRAPVAYAPVSLQRAVTDAEPTNEANPIKVETKPETKKAPPIVNVPRQAPKGIKSTKREPRCELHTLEQGGSPSAPFVAICYY